MGLLLLPLCSVATADFETKVPLSASPGGTLYVEATAAGVDAEFLLDTGAGMVTMSESLFAKVKKLSHVEHLKTMAARLANNRYQPIEVYAVHNFAIGGCNLGTVEVAVMKNGGRNLLGLSALGMAAPFSIHTAPPSLALSNCQSAAGEVVAAAY